jgi:class I fructose-bisphosphate aldolase
LAEEGGSSGIALHIGLAQKYMGEYAGEVPLILTLNGGTGIPSEGHPFSPQVASVEDAVRLGPDGVKLDSPEYDSGRQDQYPKEQREVAISPAEAMNKVVRPAGKTLSLPSGGDNVRDEDLLEQARPALEAGVAGFLFSRNQWRSPYEVSLRMTAKLKELMLEYQM